MGQDKQQHEQNSSAPIRSHKELQQYRVCCSAYAHFAGPSEGGPLMETIKYWKPLRCFQIYGKLTGVWFWIFVRLDHTRLDFPQVRPFRASGGLSSSQKAISIDL